MPPYIEPYAMPSQPPPTPDNSDAEPLLTPDEFRAIALRVQKEANHIKLWRQITIGIDVVTISVFSLVWLQSGSLYCVFMVFALLYTYALFNYLLTQRTRKNEDAVKRLAGFVESTQDVRLLGTILELHDVVQRPGVAWFELFTAVHHAIPRLLPLVQPQHAEALNTQQRERLRRGLFRPNVHSSTGYWIGSAYYFVALNALEQIGDKRDLPDIERLLKEHYITEEVRAAVECCVQVIRERVAREEGKDFLLRGDRKPEAVQTLLRPSLENAETPPQQLLRAATHDDRNTPA